MTAGCERSSRRFYSSFMSNKCTPNNFKFDPGSADLPPRYRRRVPYVPFSHVTLLKSLLRCSLLLVENQDQELFNVD